MTDKESIFAEALECRRKNGWIPNPEKKTLSTVIRGLARNKKFGRQYCPCRLRSRDKEKDKPLICHCIWHLDEIAKDGHCLCHLYYRKDTAKQETGVHE